MLVFVLGASGTLGRAIVSELHSLDISVIKIGRSISSDFQINLIDSFELFHNFSRLNKPSVIINCTAVVSLELCQRAPDLAYAVNAQLVNNLTDLCSDLGANLIHISTDHFFSDDAMHLHKEDSPVNLINEYCYSKYIGESFALSYSNSIVVRTNFTGFRGSFNPTFVEWLSSNLLSGSEITLFDDFYTSTLDSRSAAHYVCKLIRIPISGIINIASSSCTNKKDFALAYADALNISMPNFRISSCSSLWPPRNNSLGLDVSLAESIFECTMPDTAFVCSQLCHDFVTLY